MERLPLVQVSTPCTLLLRRASDVSRSALPQGRPDVLGRADRARAGQVRLHLPGRQMVPQQDGREAVEEAGAGAVRARRARAHIHDAHRGPARVRPPTPPVLSCHALPHPARGVAHAARRELTDREKARRLKILADPHALLVDPARALCTRCLFPLALSTHSLYDVGKWGKHRDNCVTWSPARLACARATNLKNRKVRVWSLSQVWFLPYEDHNQTVSW